MLPLETNGYTSQAVLDAMLGKNGAINRRWRFKLYDKNRNFLRETRSVKEGGFIKYVEKQPIRRGGSIQIDRKDFTLTDDYLDTNADDNLELWLSTLYSQIFHESPIGYWRLGDTSGTSAVDASGNAHTGTYTGGFTLNQGSLVKTAQENGAVLFNGSTGYVSIPHSAAYNVTTLSIEAWIKTTFSGVRQVIMARDDTSADRMFAFRVQGASSDGANAGFINLSLFFGATQVQFLAPGFVSDGIPHHVVATYNGAHVRIYIDGTQVLETAETRSLNSMTEIIQIGAQGALNFFNGSIDEAAFYGYALSPAQVRARHQAGSGQFYEIDFLHDYIEPICEIKMQANGTDGTPWASFSRGLFSFVYPDVNDEATGTHYDALIQDVTANLENTTVDGTNYTIATTVKYREALVALFVYAGFTSTQYSIATSTIAETTLPISKEYPIGTTILYIMNELLREMNYRQVSAGASGLITLDAWVSSGNRQPELTLTANSSSIINTAKKKSANLKDTYNKVFLKRQGSKGVTELVATATNNNASHPTSVGRIRTRTYSDLNVTAADQTTLTAMAAKKLEELARIAYRLKMKTPLLCILDNDGILRVIGVEPPPLFSAAFTTSPEIFIVTEWSEPFDDVGDCEIDADFYLNAA